jgi:hypothetical protein
MTKKISRKIGPPAIDFVHFSLCTEQRSGKARFLMIQKLKLLRKALLTQNLFSIGGTMIPARANAFRLKR